jgi:hypothetical protein
MVWESGLGVAWVVAAAVCCHLPCNQPLHLQLDRQGCDVWTVYGNMCTVLLLGCCFVTQGAKAGSRKRPAAAAEPTEAEEAGAAAAAGGAGRSKRRKQQAPTSTAVAGSPVRRSGRQAQGGAGEDEGPAVSGAGEEDGGDELTVHGLARAALPRVYVLWAGDAGDDEGPAASGAGEKE